MFRIFALVSCLIAIAAGITTRKCDDCMYISECPVAMAMLRNHGGEPAVQQLMRKAYCGHENNSVKICCSYFRQNDVNTEGDDLENHPNAQLLRDDCGEIDGYRIFGGTIATLDEFPWMVLVAYRVKGVIQLNCGGTLITARYVLTAGHCIKNKQIEYVRVGEYDLNTSTDCEKDTDICASNTQNISVTHAIVYSKYRLFLRRYAVNDIGLLRLSRPVEFTSNIATVCLPITKELRGKQLIGEYGTVTGWGTTEVQNKSNVLRKAELPVYSPNTCRQKYRNTNSNQLWTKAFCAGADGVDTCKGDSGGPFMIGADYKGTYKYVQFGITSFGPITCGVSKPGVYTDIRKYMKWILDTIKP